MIERSEAEEMAADLRNKLTYAMTLIDAMAKKNKKPTEKELRLALEGLEEAAKILTEASRS